MNRLVGGKPNPNGFWDFLLSLSMPIEGGFDITYAIDDRAINSLKKASRNLALLSKELTDVNLWLCKESKAYENLIEKSKGQCAQLVVSLPEKAWNLAKSYVCESREAVISWLRDDSEGLVVDPVYEYLCDVTGKIIKYAPQMGGTVKWHGSDEFKRNAIISAGGTDHFLTYAFASFILLQNFNVFYAISFGWSDFDDRPRKALLNPKTNALIFDDSDVWCHPFCNDVALLKSLPSERIPLYLDGLVQQGKFVTDFINESISRIDAAENTLRSIIKENKSLRKQLTAFDSYKNESAIRSARLNEEVQRLRKASNAILEDGRRVEEYAALAIENKNLALENDCLKDEILAKDIAINNLKDFVSMALDEPLQLDRDSAGIGGMPKRVATSKNNILFVGGHEKLHSKLRKLLPKVRFVHPDVTQLPQEVFNNIESVVFCVGYCSHALYWRVLQEVRKRRLVVGYTNNSNVDLILKDIETTLSLEGK